MKTIRIFISGIVQGVCFRAFIKREAGKLALNGFVKNLDDGRVEAVIEGEDKQVENLIELCKKGPSSSHVEAVKIEKIENQGFKKFKIIRL